MVIFLSATASVPGAQVGMGSSQPASISSAYILSPTASSYLSPISALSPTGTDQCPFKEPEQSRGGSLAVRAMRSVRSMARIGGWGRDSPPSTQPSNKTNKGKNGSMRIVGSGESWLAGAPSPPKDATVSSKHSATVRVSGPRHSSLDEENRPLPTIKFASPGKVTKQKRPPTASSTSSRTSEESALPRDSTSTRAQSIDSHRTSFSSRRSSGATTTSSYQASVPSIPECDSVIRKTARPTRDKDTKNGERRKRGALSNIFDITSGSSSPSTVNTRTFSRKSGSTGSVESYGEPVAVEGTTFELVRAVDPFSASRGSESFLPPSAEMSEQTVSKGLSIYVPGQTPERRARPRPLSDAIRPRPTGIIVDFPDGVGRRKSLYCQLSFDTYTDHFSALPLNMVTAATEELHDLINRLDLSVTPEASPARRWSPSSKNLSPDPMPMFSLHTIERARQLHYPDVPSSVRADRTFDVDTSFTPSKPRETPKNPLTVPFMGSISELRAPVSAPSCKPAIKQESSITSLRPYDCVVSRSTTATIRASSHNGQHVDTSTISKSSSFASYESPLKNVTIRKKRRIRPHQPRDHSSAESLHTQLRPISRPETRRQLGFSGTMGPADDTDDAEHTEEPMSSSEDSTPPDPDSDIPDELQAILSGSGPEASLDDTLSLPRSPESPISDRLSLPITISELSSPPSTASRPHFSVTVTAPSGISYEPSLHSHSDDDGDHLRDDDTGKKSFDFTGELNRLNEGGVRLSFVEQLEEAFKTPHEFLPDSDPTSDVESESRVTSAASLDWGLPSDLKSDLNSVSSLFKGCAGDRYVTFIL